MEGKVFLLEDDTSIRGLLKVALEMDGLEFKSFPTIAEFTKAINEDPPDVAILDIMLPDGSGLDALKTVKEQHPCVSCIMLSVLTKEEDKVNGLNIGADDYVGKPFSVLELTARIHAQLRRGDKRRVIKVGGISLNQETMTVRTGNRKLSLNKKEFALLKFLMLNAGIVLERERILSEVWGYETAETRTLDNHVARLRKLGVKIETVFGIGYRFGKA